ncbi:MAG: hypothetical protein FJW14_08165 [Acidimicrobiia bacterium]|nr:hypothetical protein [Acidimicrobiia bacterium]
MAFEPGSRIGHYEIVAPIGAQDDERYKASDSRVSRLVALKILPPEFSERPELRDRLERESRSISSLSHPHISAPLEVGHQEPATHFVVTEHFEGEALAARLARGPIPLDEALSTAIAIADSLDTAHRHGIVHAGLNPATVMLTAKGPKLLDFGLTRLAADETPLQAASMATTRTSIAFLTAVPTAAAPYLAPEQLAGGPIDARTDIFAFGAVLYEMVTGKPAFHEKTQALLIAAVQSVDPDPVSVLRPAAPPALDYVVRRCLSKDPRQRIQTARDVLTELRWIEKGDAGAGVMAAAPARWWQREKATWAAAAVAAVAAAALTPAVVATFEGPPALPEVHFLATSLPVATTPLAVSPDGRWLVSGINGGATFGLSLDSVTSQTLIRGVPVQPFFSPDSRSIAYFEANQLKRADIGGGPPQVICEVPPLISAGTWNSDGVILFPGAGVIHRVLAAGGQPAPITTLDQSRSETEHLGPVFLPDGRRFLFLAVSSQANESAIFVGSLDSGDRIRLFASNSKAVYAEPGYLLFNRGDSVFAQAFDAESLTLSGEPIRVASGVPLRVVAPNGSPGITSSANFAVSQTGVLAYRTGGSAGGAPVAGTEEQRSMFWFTRTGDRSASLGPAGAYVGVDLSPDGRRFAVHRHEGIGGDNWFFDLAQGRLQRLTFDASQDNSSPVWSPDGTKIAFGSLRNGRWGIYVKPADGTAAEELIMESETPKGPTSWSPDGSRIVFTENTGGGGDVWMVPVAGDRKPVPLLRSPTFEGFAQVSSDGKWLAYASNETGRAEVYVRPFPDGPGKWQVSTEGGTFPRWRRDGRELFFYFNNSVISAAINSTASSIEPGVPAPLFGVPNPSSISVHAAYNRFAVTADGQRVLISLPGGGGPNTAGGVADSIAALADQGTTTSTGAAPNAVMVVLNWTRLLARN